MRHAPLRELAKVIRSKNSGPFEITFDVLFDSKQIYEQVKNSGALTREGMAKTYGVSLDDIIVFMSFDPAMAFEMTLRRHWAQVSIGDRDTSVAQAQAQ